MAIKPPKIVVIGDKEVKLAGQDLVEDYLVDSNSFLPNKFYFKQKPPNNPIKIKSSVVIRLPLYDAVAEETSPVPGKEGMLSFQNVYRNYGPEDFARLITENGALSKAIRYGLLYNYFGFPVANLNSGIFVDENYLQINATKFGDNRFQIRRRVASRDKSFGLNSVQVEDGATSIFMADNADLPGNELGASEFDATPKAVFIEYAKGLYQLGELGELPSFVDDVPQSPPENIFGTIPEKLNTTAINTESPSYNPVKEFFNFLHGSLGNGETQASIGGSFSYVEPIGVDAQASGLKVENDSTIEGFQQMDLRFYGKWSHESNPIDRTYSRAWAPSTADGNFNYQGEYIPGTKAFYLYSSAQTTLGNYTWRQQMTPNAFIDDSLLNSLSLTLGDTFNNSSDWQHYPASYIEQVDDPDSQVPIDFKTANIASLYKLVPSNLDVAPQNLLPFREDPAKTLNKIYPRIFKYVRDVVPMFMTQGRIPSPAGGGTVSTPLNASDIITPEALESPDGLQNKSFLRKFRLGWELQEFKQISSQPIESYKYDKLGPTHIIGSLDKTKAALAFYDIKNQNEDPTIRYFRNKFSVIFKTQLHLDYFLNPQGKGGYHFDKYQFAVNGYFSPLQKEQLPVQTKGILPNSEDISGGGSHYIPSEMVGEYSKHADSDDGFNMLEKSVFFSTKLLSYMFLKRPSGYQTGNVLAYLNPAATLANELDVDVFNAPAAPMYYPSILNPNLSSEEIKALLKGFTYSELGLSDASLPAIAMGEDGTIKQDQIDIYKETGSLTGESANLVIKDYNETDGDSGDQPDLKINQESPLAFPIWKYDAGTKQEISQIEWKKLNEFKDKEDALKEAFSQNPSLTAIVNYGIPEWVTGLRIYPCTDNQTIATRVDPFAGSNTPQTTSGIAQLGSYKNKPMEEVTSAAVKIIAEPSFAGFGHYGYVEVRYVVELDIDERKLIMDMVGQGVASFDGTVEEYENAGFVITELLGKSNGNVSSADLIETYESGDYDFSTSLGVDLNDFPSLFGSNPDFDCPPFPPDVVTEKATQILEQSPEDIFAVTSYICLSDFNVPTVRFKEAPGPNAPNVGYLDDNTTVKVLKEWVNGKGEYNKIVVRDPSSTHNGKEGFIHPKFLRPISPSAKTSYKIFFEQRFPNRPLKGTLVTFMSEMAEALIPTWYRDMDQPYYHRADGEYWVSVTMPNDCIVDDQDLEAQKELAKKFGLRKILDFQNKSYTDQELIDLVETYLVVRAEDYMLSARPGAKVKILVKVGGIYVNSFPSKEESLQELKNKSAKILSLDSRYFDLHLQQALFSLNQIYLDIFSSEFIVEGINLAKEAERLAFVPTAIKKIVAANGFDINKQSDNIINIGFDNNFKLTFVSYIEDASEVNSKQEELLSVGFDYFKQQEPFIFPYTMAFLYYHRDIKNPLLKWQTIFEQWLPEPKPQILPKQGPVPLDLPSQKCGFSYFSLPPFTEIINNVAQRLDELLDLNPRYDLGAFQFSLLQFFPPCPKPPPGKGTAFFKFLSEIDKETTVAENGEFLGALAEEADRLEQYVGDFLSSGAALRDIKSKIFDLDDLYAYVLNYITPEVLYSKICKCFLDVIGAEEIGIPNLTINASGGSGGLNLNPSTIQNNPKQIFNSKGASFNNNFVDEDGNFKGRDAFMEQVAVEDLLCSFCFRIPSVFFRLPTTDLLDSLIQALKALLEFALAQILLELIAALLDALLTCPELNCTAGETRLKDYGAQNIGDLLNTYSDNASQDLVNCGLIAEQAVIDDMLVSISEALTTPEVLGLFDGSPSKETLETVEQILFAYPSIQKQPKMKDISKIADFFECLGKKMDPAMFDFLDKQANEKINDPVLCTELATKAKKLLKDKCGDIPGFDDIADKNLNHDIDKYKNLAKIIRDNDDLSSQLPPLFTDGKGTQGLLSGQKAETADFALQKALDSIIITAEPKLIENSIGLTKPKRNKLVKGSDVLEEIVRLPDTLALPLAIGTSKDIYENELIEFTMPDGGKKSVDQFLFNISQGLNFADAKEDNTFKLNLSDEDFVHFILNPPAADEETGQKIYTNNYQVRIKGLPNLGAFGIDVMVSGDEMPPLGDDVKQFLQKFSLKGETPEQAQFFSSLLLQSLGLSSTNDDGIVEIPDNATTNIVKELFEGDVYYSILSSMLEKMAQTCGDSNLLKKYGIQPFSDAAIVLFSMNPLFLTVQTQEILTYQLMGAPNPTAADFTVEYFLPDLFRCEIENLNLTKVGSKVGPQTFVDFNYGSELAKQAYDFSKYHDPNSDVIGMPHFAILEAVISWTMQLFIGETLVKSIAILPFFPKELFFNELYVQFVVAQYRSWLLKQLDGTDQRWFNLVTRIVYEKPEFTPVPGSNKPALAGEFGGGAPAAINGSIYDTQLGREVPITSWQDATAYYIRQNFERPLEFLKTRLKETELKAYPMDTEVNPFNFICHKNLREIHTSNFEMYDGLQENLASTLFGPEAIHEFKNGKFVFQFYYRFEELEPGDPLYNERLVARDAFKTDPLGGGQFDPDADEVEDAGPDDSPPDARLKGILNNFGISNLWKIMSNGPFNVADGTYEISIQDQQKPFHDFFKSIKLGVRLVYALVDSSEEIKDEDGNPVKIIDQDVPQKPEIKKLKEDLIVTLLANNAQNPELIDFQLREKCLLVTEQVSGEGNPIVKTNIIFPIFSKEIDVPKSENSPFSASVDSYIAEDENFAESTLIKLTKYAKDFQGAEIIKKLVSEMSTGPEMRALFTYSIPISKMVSMLAIYNALAVNQDKDLESSFDETKEILKQSIQSIYDVKGSKSYAYEPAYVKEKGGERGIASSASSKVNED